MNFLHVICSIGSHSILGERREEITVGKQSLQGMGAMLNSSGRTALLVGVGPGGRDGGEVLGAMWRRGQG